MINSRTDTKIEKVLREYEQQRFQIRLAESCRKYLKEFLIIQHKNNPNWLNTKKVFDCLDETYLGWAISTTKLLDPWSNY